jgi:3-oxoadipate enol-lactonase
LNVNGIRLAYAVAGPTGGSTIVLANSLAADLSMWEPQLAALTEKWRVLRYDMRGHGGSAATAGDYSLGLLAADLLGLLDGLALRRVHVVGTSLGGMVGQFVAAKFPTRLVSLTLCATSSDAQVSSWDDRVRQVRKNGIAPQVDATIDRWFTPEFRDHHPGAMKVMREMVLRTSQDGYAGCAAAIRDMRLSSLLPSIVHPTLVIAGEQDLSTPMPMLEHIATSIPRAELVKVPRAAHMPTLEQPEICNAEISRFLTAVEAGLSPEEAGCTHA